MPYWAVVRTAPNHERLVAEGVALAGFETFIPRIRVKVGAKWRATPLFGSYFFVRIVDRWRAIERSMGVAGVVKFGAAPARCPDAEIAMLLAQADPDDVVRLSARLPQPAPRIIAPGAAVGIADGPLAEFNDLYACQTARERELVLINILGAAHPVEISAGLVVPAQ